jgi:hypothetical protein
LPIISGRRGFGPSSYCAHLRGGPGRRSSVSRAPRQKLKRLGLVVDSIAEEESDAA